MLVLREVCVALSPLQQATKGGEHTPLWFNENLSHEDQNCYTPDADRLTKWDPQLQASKLARQLTTATTNRKPFELQANPFHTIYVQVYFALPIFRRCRFAFWVAQKHFDLDLHLDSRVVASAVAAFHRNVNKLLADPLTHTRTHRVARRREWGLGTWAMSRLAWPGI